MKHRPWSILLLLSVAELLGMSLWFSASAVSPHFQEIWALSPEEAGWLTTVVQLGFVAGTALVATFNIADIIPSRFLFAVSGLLAAAANAALVIAPDFATGLVLRFLTGMLLAGVYPPAMKMIATWFVSARGFAIGTIVGALTLGKATPYLLGALPSLDYRSVVLTASLGAGTGALMVAIGYRDGPAPFARRPFSWSLAGDVLRDRRTRLAIGGYLGHMWELYAMWTLMSLYFADFFSARGLSVVPAHAYAGATAFAVIGAGAVGSVVAGRWADVIGRERVTIWAMGVSGMCALIMGHLIGAAPVLVISLALLWGFAVVADSAQFSALVTEVAPSHAVGTALTLQTSMGFLLTAFSIWATIELQAKFGWAIAFSMLAVGPVLGIMAMIRLRNARRVEV